MELTFGSKVSGKNLRTEGRRRIDRTGQPDLAEAVGVIPGRQLKWLVPSQPYVKLLTRRQTPSVILLTITLSVHSPLTTIRFWQGTMTTCGRQV
jgi:hypothetical protein